MTFSTQATPIVDFTEVDDAAETFLIIIKWMSKQGWTVVALFLCASFTSSRAFEQTISLHALPFTLGFVCTSITFWFVRNFVRYLRNSILLEEPNAINSEETPYEKDFWVAIRGLCQLGFIAGYLGAHDLVMGVLNDLFETWSARMVGFYVVLVAIAAMREYKRATTRIEHRSVVLRERLPIHTREQIVRERLPPIYAREQIV